MNSEQPTGALKRAIELSPASAQRQMALGNRPSVRLSDMLTALELVGSAVLIASVDGEPLFANAACEKLVGAANPQPLLGSHPTVLLTTDNDIEVLRTFAASQRDYTSFRDNLILAKPSGQKLSVQWSFDPLVGGDDDSLRWIHVITPSSNIDPSSRHPAVDRLESIIQEMSQLARIGYWNWELPGSQPFWSDTLCDILEVKRGSQFDYDGCLAFYEEPDRVRRVVDACVHQGTVFKFEANVITAKGQARRVWVSGQPQKNQQGEIVRVFGCFQDITESYQQNRRKHDLELHLQQSENQKSVGIMAGGVAHDFNNLLTSILGNADLIQRELDPDSPALGPLKNLTQAADQAAGLCRQLMAYAGRGKKVFSNVHLSQLVETMAKLMQTVITPQAELTLKLDPNIPLIHGDSNQVSQVIMNLITNASDALEKQPGRISIETKAVAVSENDLDQVEFGLQAKPGDFVVLSVNDTGCGMNASTRQKIFEPFFSTKESGRGIGLAAIGGTLQTHGGFLTIDSAPGQGSQFHIYFPALKESNREPTIPSPRGTLRWQADGKLLIVDDDPLVRLYVAESLREIGITPMEASDGQSGLETLSRGIDHFCAAVIDRTMPKLNGLKLLQHVRKINANFPVILVSGYDRQELEQQLANDSNLRVLNKPFLPEVLYSALHELIPDHVRVK